MSTTETAKNRIEEMTPHDILKRWPRICAHLICESLGYFTPVRAALALKHAKMGEAYSCEWYSDINRRRGLDLFDEEGLKVVTQDVLRWAIQGRHRHKGFMADYQLARKVIERELADQGPQLASWF